MDYELRADVFTKQLYVTAALKEGKALEVFMNLQTPSSLAELEEGLRSLLQGKEEKFEALAEHTKVFADKEKTKVQSFVTPGTDEPIAGEYPSLEVYELVCRLNINTENMNKIWDGSQDVPRAEDELKEKMDLVSPSGGMKK